MKRLSFALAVLILSCKIFANSAPLFDDLGPLDEAIGTQVELAKRYINQGLLFFYGFDYMESIRSFEGAIASDPKCAYCHAFKALALGSKTNTPILGNERQQALEHLKQARALAHEEELPFIQALEARYAEPSSNAKPGNAHHFGDSPLVSVKEKEAFREAMEKIVNQDAQNSLMLSIYLYALFDESEWDFYDKAHRPKPATERIIEIARKLLALNPHHPNGLHLFIHATESSGDPTQAEGIADTLAEYFPNLEHLAHMPSHIYLMTDRLHDATEQNLVATAAHARYVEACHKQGFEIPLNYLAQHNYHFLWTASSWEGRYTLSNLAAQKLQELTPLSTEKQIKEDQWWYQISWLNDLTFRRWQATLDKPMPNKNLDYITDIAHFAKSVAASHLGKLPMAEKHLKAMHEKNDNPWNQKQLDIARAIAQASFIEAQGEDKKGLEAWLTAVSIQEKAKTIEPPTWLTLVKMGLARAYLRQGKAFDALDTADSFLRLYPGNPWFLKLKTVALTELNEAEQATESHRAFVEANRFSDVLI